MGSPGRNDLDAGSGRGTDKKPQLAGLSRSAGNDEPGCRTTFTEPKGWVTSTTHRQPHPMSGGSWNPSTDRWHRLRRMKMRPVARDR